MSAQQPSSMKAGTAARRGRWGRLAGVAALTSVLGLGTMPAIASPVLPATPPIVAIGWQQLGGGHSASPWGHQEGDEATAGGTSTSSVKSEAASTQESTGVVLITTVLTDGEAAGTGIVLTSNGEILTNYHVVEGSTSIEVTVAGTGKAYTATVVGHDQSDDVALLQLKGASGLAPATIDDDTVSAGDKVTAVGNAGGTGSLTAASGTVTAMGASITTESENSESGETLANLIMTDADVVPGDSGGPLLDAEGEVIGIDTAASSGIEIDGYAIPITRAMTIVKTILTGQETSAVTIGANAYLGIEISSSMANSDSADSYGSRWGRSGFDDTTYPSSTGAAVTGVVSQGPAAAAGLAVGDTITAIAGDAVTSAADITTDLAGHEPGDKVTITWTDTAGESHTSLVTLGSSPIA